MVPLGPATCPGRRPGGGHHDRLGRRYLETIWAIYDLQRRGIRLRSLANNEGEWTRFLDADPDSPEAFMGNMLASMAAYVAS